ncbi:MAG: DUF3108 domain-containing protein [Longimicrobiales bacterium]
MIFRRWQQIALSLLLALPVAAGAQTHSKGTADRTVAAVPFGPGERMTYKVSLSLFGEVGNGSIEVLQLDTIQGHPSYKLRLYLKGGIPLAHVQDEYQSWLDIYDLVSHRFFQDVREVRYKRKRTIDFYPAERRWHRIDNDESGVMPTELPLDDLSFLYYVRTLPLNVGDTYTLDRYWKEDGNPVTVKVIRRDTISVPAGRFAVIVIQPIIRTRGLFSEGGKAEVFFTDDARRIPVQIKTNVPVIKSMNMQLETYSPGKRLAPVFNSSTGTH